MQLPGPHPRPVVLFFIWEFFLDLGRLGASRSCHLKEHQFELGTFSRQLEEEEEMLI